jgi:hypothetical protein
MFFFKKGKNPMRPIKAIIGILFICCAAGATPTWMWVGTYAIDNYTAYGGGEGGDLTQAINGANCFWNAVNAYSTVSPYRYVTLTDAQVTRSAVGNNTTREYCDFVYFDGHGSYYSIFLGNTDPPYGYVLSPDMHHGTGYNRWVYYYSCATLFYHSGWPTYWSYAFNGLQVMLGFASVTWGISSKDDLHNEFWERWVENHDGMWYAHYEACADIIYGQEGWGIAPAAVASADGNGLVYDSKDFDSMGSEAGGVPQHWISWEAGTPWY